MGFGPKTGPTIASNLSGLWIFVEEVAAMFTKFVRDLLSAMYDVARRSGLVVFRSLIDKPFSEGVEGTIQSIPPLTSMHSMCNLGQSDGLSGANLVSACPVRSAPGIHRPYVRLPLHV